MALSLYRKYRPEVFADVVGQEHVEKTLINAIAEGTVAHAYLFCGPRGTGKTTTARLLAKALLCEAGPSAQPDGTCLQCTEIAQGTHPDVFELDAASRTGVDNVREEIIGRVNFAPTRGRSKIYIIDEVHMLSTAAFNALLKTLEEPPEHVVFVLCTTDPHKVPETIRSRCQRFDFRRFSVEEIMGYLERICKGEGFEYEPEALEFIAAKSAGGMRDATTSLEQVAVYTEGKITLDEATRMFGQIDVAALFDIADRIARQDTASCFVWVDGLVGKGVDLSQFARDLASHMRNLYVTAITGGENGIVSCTAAQLAQYQQQAGAFGGTDRLARALDVCGGLVSELRNSSDARLSVEIAMTRLTRPDSELTLEALAERIEALEAGGAAPRIERQQAFPATDDGASGHDDAIMEEPTDRGDGNPDLANADPILIEHEAEGEPIDSTASPAETLAQESRQAAATSDMTPERVRLALLSVINREDPSVGALLSDVSVAEEGGRYRILFPAGADFQMRIASGADARAIIGKAFEEVLGESVEFDCQIGSFSGLSAREAPVQSEPLAEGAPYDEGYYDDLAAFEDGQPAGDEAAASIADALSAFGEGVRIQEIDSEQ